MGMVRNLLDIVGFIFMVAFFMLGVIRLFRSFKIGLIRTLITSFI